MLEKTIERWLGEKIKKLGGLWLKFTSPGRTGVPDRILILKGQVLFVEMKAEGGTLSAVQKATFKAMNTAGVTIHVVYGKEGAQAFLGALERAKDEDEGHAAVREWRGSSGAS